MGIWASANVVIIVITVIIVIIVIIVNIVNVILEITLPKQFLQCYHIQSVCSPFDQNDMEALL